MKKLNLKIVRHTYNNSEATGGQENTIGDFYIDGEFFCYSLEDRIRFEKVYGKTAIPAGKYRVIVNRSNRFKRLMPLLLDVENFRGIRIHGGNTAEDSHGCPLIAFKTDKVKIWSTAEKKLTAYLIAWEKENPTGEIWITIENNHVLHTPEWDKKEEQA
jgi:hypothetical protein